MKVKNNFRWLDNASITIVKSGEDVQRAIVFGRWDTAVRIVECQNSDYVDIYFVNGSVAFGVYKSMIEQHGIEFEGFAKDALQATKEIAEATGMLKVDDSNNSEEVIDILEADGLFEIGTTADLEEASWTDDDEKEDEAV